MTSLRHACSPRRVAPTLTGAVATLVLAITTTALPAQTLLADYPLLSDLKDTTTNYGPITLTGNPTAPAAPNNGVCHNGIYRYNTNGQDIRTPYIAKLDFTDFQVDVEFKINGWPVSTYGAPILQGGHSYRWLGIYVQQNGTVGIKHNNSNRTWSTTKLQLGTWYSAVLQYEKGTVQLYIDGALVLKTSVGTLNHGSNPNFTTNDFSTGLAHNGCIRQLRIYNDANLTGGQFTVAGFHCNGVQISGAMPWPQATKTYRIDMTGGGAGLPALLFLGVKHPKPIDLTAAGAPGCTWFVSPVIGFGTTASKSGTAFLVLPIPNMIGAVGWWQWFSFNPTANKLRWTMSDYATMVIGK